MFQEEQNNRGNGTGEKADTKPDIRVTVFPLGDRIRSTGKGQRDKEKLQVMNTHGQVPFFMKG